METVTIRYEGREFQAARGQRVSDALREAGIPLDAPCGGKGQCGKCRILVDGVEERACQYRLARDAVLELPRKGRDQIMQAGLAAEVIPDGTARYALAFDLGTTTIVASLLDGQSGALLAQESCLNPQMAFGADVISRIEAVQEGNTELSACVRTVLAALTTELAMAAGVELKQIGCAAVAGNTAMHHLLLEIDTTPLVKPPYMPKVFEALELHSEGLLPISGTVRFLPNIAGFVGGDTVGCMLATRFDRCTRPALLVDIGTNGELVLTDGKRRVACSTAAGPAFEGAKISCGMRGETGAVDHVWLEEDGPHYSTIGGAPARGLCGSGLLDLTAVLLRLGMIDGTGRLQGGDYHLDGSGVVLTQKDVREVQLAKGAIRAGIELLTQSLHLPMEAIEVVYLAGAFGNYLNPTSACEIGLFPPVLLDKIQGVGNAAGEGARCCAISREEFTRSKTLASETEFLELASLPAFQDRFVDALEFSEEEV